MKKLFSKISIMLLAFAAIAIPYNANNVETKTNTMAHIRRAKVAPSFSFTYEKDGEQMPLANGTHFTEGEVPTLTAKVDEDGANYTVYYTMNDGETNLGSDAPTTPGTYAINISVSEDDSFESGWGFRWYVIDPAPEEGQIKVHLVADKTVFIYDGNPHTPEWHFENEKNVRVDNVQYTAKYSSDSTGYDSEEAPTDIAWYSISITITDDTHLIDGSWWIVFHIDDSAEAFIRDWNALRAEGGSDGMCAFTKDGSTDRLVALINRYDNLNETDRAIVDEEFETDGETLIFTSIEYFRNLLQLDVSNANGIENSKSVFLLADGNNQYILLLVSLFSIVALSYAIVTKKRNA